MNAFASPTGFAGTMVTSPARHAPHATWTGARRFAAALLATGGMLLSEPVPAETPVESATAFINHYRQVARARNLPATVACFSDNISLFPPDGPTIVGKAAVKTLYEDFFKSSDSVDNAFTEERTFAGDKVAVRQGISIYRERSHADGQVHKFRTRFVMVLVRERGAWQLATYAWQELKPDE